MKEGQHRDSRFRVAPVALKDLCPTESHSIYNHLQPGNMTHPLHEPTGSFGFNHLNKRTKLLVEPIHDIHTPEKVHHLEAPGHHNLVEQHMIS